MSDWEIHLYTNEQETLWDNFVKNESINGTFLQEWRFLNYHPKNRFDDYSLMIYYKDQLAAVIPACSVTDLGRKVFFSHRGSTYGGPVLSKKVYRAAELLGLIDELDAFLKACGFEKIVLKPTLSLFCSQDMDLLEYCLCHRGYREYKELEQYLNYDHFLPDVMTNLTNMKQRLVKKCIKAGIDVIEFADEERIVQFHSMLAKNLEKFQIKPVHTVQELIELKNRRLPEEISFYGAFLDGKMAAGTMVFHFAQSRCAHTQYLAANPEFNKLSPLSYVYYDMAGRYRSLGYRYLSWGITSEHLGLELNMGLTQNKESFGSEYMINHIYEKDLSI